VLIELSDPLTIAGAKVIHHYYLSDCRGGASTRSTYASNTSRSMGPSTASEGPIPQRLMLESSVEFFPRL
jgi:hypothetical protein